MKAYFAFIRATHNDIMHRLDDMEDETKDLHTFLQSDISQILKYTGDPPRHKDFPHAPSPIGPPTTHVVDLVDADADADAEDSDGSI